MNSAWGIDHGDVSKALGPRMALAAARSGAKVAAGGKRGFKAGIGRSLHPVSFDAQVTRAPAARAPRPTSGQIMNAPGAGGAPSLATNAQRQATYTHGKTALASHATAANNKRLGISPKPKPWHVD